MCIYVEMRGGAGAMYACQIFKAAARDLPTLDEDIAAGKFAPLRTWLNAKVHQARARCCCLVAHGLCCILSEALWDSLYLSVDACMRRMSVLMHAWRLWSLGSSRPQLPV